MIARLFGLLLVCCALWPRWVAASELQRVAIVVGANAAPPGRVTLRYAHEDARHVAEVLTAVAGFASRNVKVLLDPAPDELLGALDQELALAGKRSDETLLFFYYSGHADDRALFPRGLALPFAALKARLEDPRAKLRVGLLDSCRGGSWTGSKGLRKVEPFEIEGARELAEEGSVLIASSSGQENAHETEALKGSFFTHYWNAGLRGAADKGGDGVVTLNEAFEYARSFTIRDTALAGQTPQHPSFQMKLSGRRDFPLSTLVRERTTLLFDQTAGPVEFVRLSDGLVVLESTPGARQLKLGLPAGSYLVRRRSTEGVWARVISLSPGSPSELRESQLEPTAQFSGRTKDALGAASTSLSWQDEAVYVSASGGVRHAPIIDPGLRLGSADGTGVFLLRASARVARHLWLSAPLAAAFDAERASKLGYFVWAGAPVLGGALEAGSLALRGFVGAGADARYRVSEQHTFNASLAALGAYAMAKDANRAPTTWTTQLSLGVSETVPGTVTFNLGLAAGVNPLVTGAFAGPELDAAERGFVVALGSVQRAGLRPLPLIHVPFSDAWAIDAHASAAYVLATRGWVETYTAGISYER